MVRPKFIKVNFPIEIKLPSKEEVFKTLIQEVNDDKFSILAPALYELLLRPGDQVEIIYKGEDACYQFITSVLERLPENPPLYILAYPDEYKRIQVRSHVRVKASIEFLYNLWPKKDWPDNPPSTNKKGVTIDISGGGARVILREPVEKDDLLYIHLSLPGHSLPLRLAAQVKRVIPFKKGGLQRYEVGLAFFRISQKQEDSLIRFVFQRQLKERRQRG
ncbi:MAG: hypothetical protein PWP31_354 [Clostridia bacterium]|nr:hypothetical protein [Clostridia bacterium]